MYIDSREGVKGSLLQLECVWGCICIRQEPKNKQKDPFFHYVPLLRNFPFLHFPVMLGSDLNPQGYFYF